MAAQFATEVETSYSQLGERITRNPLLHWVRLIRGMLIAAPPERKAPLLKSLVNDQALKGDLRTGWRDAGNLSEIAFCLGQLLDAPIQHDDILRLLDFDSLGEFEAEIGARFEADKSILHLANGLWGIARFNPELAVVELRQYVERLEPKRADLTASRIGNSGNSAGRNTRRPRIARGYRLASLAELGALLRIAAAVDSASARKVASTIELVGLSEQISKTSQTLGV
jgi:hypothetical protein